MRRYYRKRRTRTGISTYRRNIARRGAGRKRVYRRQRGRNIFKRGWNAIKTGAKSLYNRYFPGIRDKALSYAKQQADIIMPQIKAYGQSQLDKAKQQAESFAREQAKKLEKYAVEKAEKVRDYALNKVKSLTGQGRKRKVRLYSAMRMRPLRGRGFFGDIWKGVKSVGGTAFNVVKEPLQEVGKQVVGNALKGFMGGRKRRVYRRRQKGGKRKVRRVRKQRGGFFPLSALAGPLVFAGVKKLTGLGRKRKTKKKLMGGKRKTVRRKLRGGAFLNDLIRATGKVILQNHHNPKYREMAKYVN